MPFLVAPLSGAYDQNGRPEGPRMDLGIIVSGKDDPAFKELRAKLPKLFPDSVDGRGECFASIAYWGIGNDAGVVIPLKELYALKGGKSRKNRRKQRKSTYRNYNSFSS